MINSLYALGSSEMRRARHLCDQFSALGPKFQLARRRIQAFILTQQRGHVLSQHEQRDMSQTTEELQSDIKAAELYAEQLRQSGMNILLPIRELEIRLRTEEENTRSELRRKQALEKMLQDINRATLQLDLKKKETKHLIVEAEKAKQRARRVAEAAEKPPGEDGAPRDIANLDSEAGVFTGMYRTAAGGALVAFVVRVVLGRARISYP